MLKNQGSKIIRAEDGAERGRYVSVLEVMEVRMRHYPQLHNAGSGLVSIKL